MLVGAGMESLDHHLLPPLDPLSVSKHIQCFLFLLYNFLYFTKESFLNIHMYMCACVHLGHPYPMNVPFI